MRRIRHIDVILVILDPGFAASARVGVLIHPVIVSFDRRVLLSLFDVITLLSMLAFSLLQCNVSVCGTVPVGQADHLVPAVGRHRISSL